MVSVIMMIIKAIESGMGKIEVFAYSALFNSMEQRDFYAFHFSTILSFNIIIIQGENR
jgi:hypothetical protein